MFTKNFSSILQNRQLTAYQVAKNTGISQGLMNEYKNGLKLPTVNNLIKIADYLNVSVDCLLGRERNAEEHSINENSANDFYLIFNDALCYRIGVLCIEQRTSVSDMIIKCNLNKHFVSYLKNLNKPLPLSTLEVISSYLKTSVEDLLSDTILFYNRKNKIVAFKNFYYLENFDNSSLANKIKQYVTTLNSYERYVLLEQVNEYMTKALYTELDNHQETEHQKLIAEEKKSIQTIEDDITEKL